MFNKLSNATPAQKRAIAERLMAAASEQERIESVVVAALAKIDEGTAMLKSVGVV